MKRILLLLLLPTIIFGTNFSSVKEAIRAATEEQITNRGYSIIDQNAQSQVLTEQASQRKQACYDDSCLVDTGKMLAAQNLFLVDIKTLSTNNYLFKIRLVSIESGETLRSTSAMYAGNLEDFRKLLIFSKKFVKKMFQKQRRRKKSKIPVMLQIQIQEEQKAIAIAQKKAQEKAEEDAKKEAQKDDFVDPWTDERKPDKTENPKKAEKTPITPLVDKPIDKPKDKNVVQNGVNSDGLTTQKTVNKLKSEIQKHSKLPKQKTFHIFKIAPVVQYIRFQYSDVETANIIAGGAEVRVGCFQFGDLRVNAIGGGIYAGTGGQKGYRLILGEFSFNISDFQINLFGLGNAFSNGDDLMITFGGAGLAYNLDLSVGTLVLFADGHFGRRAQEDEWENGVTITVGTRFDWGL